MLAFTVVIVSSISICFYLKLLFLIIFLLLNKYYEGHRQMLFFYTTVFQMNFANSFVISVKSFGWGISTRGFFHFLFHRVFKEVRLSASYHFLAVFLLVVETHSHDFHPLRIVDEVEGINKSLWDASRIRLHRLIAEALMRMYVPYTMAWTGQPMNYVSTSSSQNFLLEPIYPSRGGGLSWPVATMEPSTVCAARLALRLDTCKMSSIYRTRRKYWHT